MRLGGRRAPGETTGSAQAPSIKDDREPLHSRVSASSRTIVFESSNLCSNNDVTQATAAIRTHPHTSQRFAARAESGAGSGAAGAPFPLPARRARRIRVSARS